MYVHNFFKDQFLCGETDIKTVVTNYKSNLLLWEIFINNSVLLTFILETYIEIIK